MTQPDPSELSHAALLAIVRAYPIAIEESRTTIDELRRELTATHKELDRANAEIVRLRHDLIDLQQLMRSK